MTWVNTAAVAANALRGAHTVALRGAFSVNLRGVVTDLHRCPLRQMLLHEWLLLLGGLTFADNTVQVMHDITLVNH
jgi:hypothetical protein